VKRRDEPLSVRAALLAALAFGELAGAARTGISLDNLVKLLYRDAVNMGFSTAD
jgi:hypothetical protein